MLNVTNNAVCTNHAKGRFIVLHPKSTPVPRDMLICGTKDTIGERRSLCQNGREARTISG